MTSPKLALNFVLGTAAELIKVYPVIALALERGHLVRVIATGQSRENFTMQYRDLHLPEACLTALLTSHGDLDRAGSALRWFARALCVRRRHFQKLLLKAERTFVVVHGDTLSTLVGAWLGHRIGLDVVHVEAGLRSPHLWQPFPEEITRRLVSRLAAFHAAPDARAVANLEAAGVHGEIVATGGNTLLDAVTLSAGFPTGPAAEGGSFALVNLHRFENLNSTARWAKILATVEHAAEQTRLIFVCHPQTRRKLEVDADTRARLRRPGIEIRDRMPFSDFIGLLKQADYLITDGGSNQEECSYLGKPCLILRESTERREGLGGCCLLSRFDDKLIAGFLDNPPAYARPPVQASERPSARLLAALER